MKRIGVVILAVLLALVGSSAIAQAQEQQSPTANKYAGPTTTPDPRGEAPGIEIFGPQTYELETISLADSDGDGCADLEEMGSERRYGGMRDPTNRLDFADFGETDGVVDFLDLQVIAFLWGTAKDVSPLYDKAYDRVGPQGYGSEGRIDIRDLQNAYMQFGDRCTGAVTIQLKDYLPDICEGNTRELPGVLEDQVEVPPEGTTVCFVVRDGSGTIVDATISEDIAEEGEVAAICISCVGPEQSDPGAWYRTSASVKREQKWPPRDRICAFGRCINIPQTVIVGFYMYCSWDFFDGPSTHIYDGAVVNWNCYLDVSTRYPWRWVNSDLSVEYNPVLGSFAIVARAAEVFQYQPSPGAVLQTSTFRLQCRMGPWGEKSCWTN